MIRRFVILLLLTLLCPWRAQAHLGSPDVFYDGLVGPYPVAITIRMPAVVPGRAGITVQVQGGEGVSVTFTPIFSKTDVKNTPPPEPARLVDGETNLFNGDLWLMTRGAYSIDVQVKGKSGGGSVQIPVNSVATHQLPLPPWLGGILLALGALLFCGAIAIVAAAAGESVLPPVIAREGILRRRYWTAAVVTTMVLSLSLYGGKKWWDSDEGDFRERLVEGGWPDLAAEVRTNGTRRTLHLTLGKEDFERGQALSLAPDHGKLLHLYLVQQGGQGAFAHLHPVRKEDKKFNVPLPPLPEGDYELLCDLTLADSGRSSTATNLIHIPAITVAPVSADPDDSWVEDSSNASHDKPGVDTICHLPDGVQVIWKAHAALRTRQDAGLTFAVRDESGHAIALEPYMGMLTHTAVLRSDGRVFAHLHPSGNISMAAQSFFDAKLAKETGGSIQHNVGGSDAVCSTTGSATTDGGSTLILPYEFPTPGNYRLWVQIKTGGRVRTAIFDTTVQDGSL